MATGNGIHNAPTDRDGARRYFSYQEESEFPFPVRFSFAPLVRFWKESASRPDAVLPEFSRAINKEIDKLPALLEPIEADSGFLEEHQGTIQKLMSAVFPPAFWKRDYSGAFLPFTFKSFYATPGFSRFLLDENMTLIDRSNIELGTRLIGRTLNAYLVIAKIFYGIDAGIAYPLIFTAYDDTIGVDRHFKIAFDPRFCEIKLVGELPPLSDDDRKMLQSDLNNLSLWQRLIPADRFEIHGFTLINAVDVTDQEELSGLRQDLIESDALSSHERFVDLQRRIRGLLRKPDLVLGVAAVKGEQVMFLNSGQQMDTGCIYSDSLHARVSDYDGSVFDQCLEEEKMKIIEDVAELSSMTHVEKDILAKGMRNVLVAPLRYNGELVGVLSLTSPKPGDLNSVNSIKLYDILPLFALAVRRSMDELNNRLQKIIREEYTSIHPAVEWRFRDAALHQMEAQRQGREPEPEPIVFEGVYPLYNVSDIRNSSIARNSAIQNDLIAQLGLARRVVERAVEERPLLILFNLVHRIDQHIKSIEGGIGAGAESSVLSFLREEVESRFEHLNAFGVRTEQAIIEYRSQIHQAHGFLYQRRREYEESVAEINRSISSFIETEENKAQGVFQHYFEKHETDGVDVSIYIGASLAENGKFDLLYLREFRLWQLMLLCGLARRQEELKPKLAVPLDTTHLVLVQDQPLSIRFRHDEKQFDVDGAYNIRYEIIKKRIDKATIRGTEERLTQPRMIAIVYSHPREAFEYRQYIDFLIASGYLADEVEDLELEDLQGVQGLRALRVTVAIDHGDAEIMGVPEAVQRAISKMVELPPAPSS